jgi:hypothetical protein
VSIGSVALCAKRSLGNPKQPNSLQIDPLIVKRLDHSQEDGEPGADFRLVLRNECQEGIRDTGVVGRLGREARGVIAVQLLRERQYVRRRSLVPLSVACQLDDFARLAHAKVHQRRATEDHADVTGELISVNSGDQKVAQARGSDHLCLASLHNKERYVGLAAFNQDFAARDFDESLRGRQSVRSARNSAPET